MSKFATIQPAFAVRADRVPTSARAARAARSGHRAVPGHPQPLPHDPHPPLRGRSLKAQPTAPPRLCLASAAVRRIQARRAARRAVLPRTAPPQAPQGAQRAARDAGVGAAARFAAVRARQRRRAAAEEGGGGCCGGGGRQCGAQSSAPVPYFVRQRPAMCGGTSCGGEGAGRGRGLGASRRWLRSFVPCGAGLRRVSRRDQSQLLQL